MEDLYSYYNQKFRDKGQFGDFSTFYIVIAVVTIIAAIIFIINIVLGCCSEYSEYWNDRHTGNRFIISLWTSTPHQQPPLDYTELNTDHLPQIVLYETQEQTYQYSNVEYNQSTEQVAQPKKESPTKYFEMQKRESDI
ncbi:uncharacterized protein [Onthophagus taurus]|uniref:uncharacterized protein n=1 Tax=Onthophagus taurus TaxID=166361 RepID=UPI000C20F638|nr:uncharacterized protein LOC111418559 [Onthophagus taurus]